MTPAMALPPLELRPPAHAGHGIGAVTMPAEDDNAKHVDPACAEFAEYPAVDRIRSTGQHRAVALHAGGGGGHGEQSTPQLGRTAGPERGDSRAFSDVVRHAAVFSVQRGWGYDIFSQARPPDRSPMHATLLSDGAKPSRFKVTLKSRYAHGIWAHGIWAHGIWAISWAAVRVGVGNFKKSLRMSVAADI